MSKKCKIILKEYATESWVHVNRNEYCDKGTIMSKYQYNTEVINSCIQKMRNMANNGIRYTDAIALSAEPIGDMANKVTEINTSIEQLHTALLSLISATADTTQVTLDALVANDEELEGAIDSSGTVTTQSSNSNDDEYEDIPERSDS